MPKIIILILLVLILGAGCEKSIPAQVQKTLFIFDITKDTCHRFINSCDEGESYDCLKISFERSGEYGNIEDSIHLSSTSTNEEIYAAVKKIWDADAQEKAERETLTRRAGEINEIE